MSPFVLTALLANDLEKFKSDTPRDPDGLYIVDGDNVVVKLFSIVVPKHDDWSTIPLLNDYIETMVRYPSSPPSFLSG
jgi:hypothetical protein